MCRWQSQAPMEAWRRESCPGQRLTALHRAFQSSAEELASSRLAIGLLPRPAPSAFPFTPCPSGCVHSNLRGQGGLPQPHRTWISNLLFRLEGLKPKTLHF